MGTISIIAMAGTKADLIHACRFPSDVKFDKVVKVEIPDSHGLFPDLSAYDSADFASFESTSEDGQLHRYMTKCVDAVLDFTSKNTERLEKLNFRNINCQMHGMKTGGQIFCVAGFVDYQPLQIDKRRPLNLIIGGN